MFTGIIEEIGSVRKIVSIRGGKQIDVRAGKIVTGLKSGDSLAVNGICLTVIRLERDGFVVDAVGETLSKTTIKYWSVRQRVNLERALRADDRLGGHFVQGHINGLARVIQMTMRGDNWYLQLELPPALGRYLISEGSIAVDGASLTVADLLGRKAGISIIPHTYTHTIIGSYKIGQRVNIETDFLARYIEKFTAGKIKKPAVEPFSVKWFNDLGYE